MHDKLINNGKGSDKVMMPNKVLMPPCSHVKKTARDPWESSGATPKKINIIRLRNCWLDFDQASSPALPQRII